MSEDLWRAGENPTIPINAYRLTNSSKPAKKMGNGEMSTRTQRGTASRPHNDDDGIT